MKLKLCEPKYHQELRELLKEFSIECFGNSGNNVNVEQFVNGHWAIYLAMGDSGEVIGFSSYVINDYFGMRETTVANTYVYVTREHRRSRAMYLFSIQTGKLCVDNNFALEHYYASGASLKLSSKLKGEKIYEAYIYPVDEVSRVFNRLKNKVRIKE